MDAPRTLVAECANCAAWRFTPGDGHATAANVGYCGAGLFPPAGAPRCESYQASEAFKREIVSSMLKDHGPMAMPVRLVGGQRSARAIRKKLGR